MDKLAVGIPQGEKVHKVLDLSKHGQAVDEAIFSKSGSRAGAAMTTSSIDSS